MPLRIKLAVGILAAIFVVLAIMLVIVRVLNPPRSDTDNSQVHSNSAAPLTPHIAQ